MEKGQYMLILMRICKRDGSGMVEMKIIFWWNDRYGHQTCLCGISFYVHTSSC